MSETATQADAGTPGHAKVEDVEEAMRDVVDPELGINVVDLGLVYGVHVDDDNVVHPRHDADLGGLPADRRHRGPDQLGAGRPGQRASRSTGSGCRRGARTRSPTRAASSCGRSASTSEPARSAPSSRFP